MLAAAKEQIPAASNDPCALFPLAADPAELEARFGTTPQLGKNSPPGFPRKNPALHPGNTWSNSGTALGIEPGWLVNGVRSRCTGKERDTESGLDNFGARYNASNMGRFMSPDPLGGSRRDPQTLNKYAFSRNNPIRFIDPTGLYIVDANCAKDKKYAAQAERFEKARQQDLKSKDSAVRSAAAAYGDPGKANGVTVNFGDKKTVEATCGAGAAGCTQGGFTADANGKVSPDVKVLIRTGLGDTELQRNTAHEGSHVEDHLNFINSFDLKSLSFDSALNFARYDTEFKAYAIGNAIGSDPYTVGTCGSSPCVFRPGTRPEETYRTIDQMLTDPKSSYRAKGLDVLIHNPELTKPH